MIVVSWDIHGMYSKWENQWTSSVSGDLMGLILVTLKHIYIYCQPASWHQAQENMNERCNLSQLNALFKEGKTHIPWVQNWGHKFGSWAINFSIVAPFLGPESGPCFGPTKHKQELFNTGSKCATAAASWQQRISVIPKGTCPRSLLYHLFEAPGLGPT